MKEYQPTDEFIAKMGKIKYQDFCYDYCGSISDEKKCRNCYDSRMRKKNLIQYHMKYLTDRKIEKLELENHNLTNKKTRTIGTQTEVHSMQLKSGGFSIIRSKNLTN